MEENEIRRANRAALPKLLLFMVLCLAVGGTAGYFAARYGLNTLTGNLKSAGAFFGTNIAPWLLLAVAVLSPAVCFSVYLSAKKLWIVSQSAYCREALKYSKSGNRLS